ncbi:hypothetical protein ID866_11608 [Astraeus odoratus]|nr:hypothetical protein ID866_11608 [Astraeus odoratus]
MEHGDLSVYLDKNRDIFRLPLVYDIAKGLEYLHKMQPAIAHGDLKCVRVIISACY